MPAPNPIFANGNPDWLRTALHYWERRRILYNLVLSVVFLLWIAPHWTQFGNALHLADFAALLILALLANLCYTAAYLVDVAAWHSALRASWLRRRWVLWMAGMLFAVLVESYWIADEILSPVVLGK